MKNSQLQIEPDGRGWRIDGSGGSLAVRNAPEMSIESFRSRLQGGAYFLTDAHLRSGDAGHVSRPANSTSSRTSISSGSRSIWARF